MDEDNIDERIAAKKGELVAQENAEVQTRGTESEKCEGSGGIIKIRVRRRRAKGASRGRQAARSSAAV